MPVSSVCRRRSGPVLPLRYRSSSGPRADDLDRPEVDRGAMTQYTPAQDGAPADSASRRSLSAAVARRPLLSFFVPAVIGVVLIVIDQVRRRRRPSP